MALADMFPCATQGDVVEKDAVFPDFGRFSDYQTSPVIDEKARTDFSPRESPGRLRNGLSGIKNGG